MCICRRVALIRCPLLADQTLPRTRGGETTSAFCKRRRAWLTPPRPFGKGLAALGSNRFCQRTGRRKRVSDRASRCHHFYQTRRNCIGCRICVGVVRLLHLWHRVRSGVWPAVL